MMLLHLVIFILCYYYYPSIIIHQFRSLLESHETGEVDNQPQTGRSVFLFLNYKA